MNISRKNLNRLNALSKELYGVSSHWQKAYKKGLTHLVEEIPGKVRHHKATRESATAWPTVAQIYRMMLKVKRAANKETK